MRLWAASPDFVILAVSLIREYKPGLVLEIGSGVSTIISGYALNEIGDGQLISLEHEAHFAEVTAGNVASHNLSHIATVLHAPLKLLNHHANSQLWYDTAALDHLPEPIDLLVVDGPPSGTAPMARYPALPVLYDRLKPGAYILVDDFMRDDEYTMVNRWLDEFDLTIVRTYANEKGAVILRKPL
jgi:predicted O-methyltransferase YrrM